VERERKSSRTNSNISAERMSSEDKRRRGNKILTRNQKCSSKDFRISFPNLYSY
jgi:hypothetical protein